MPIARPDGWKQWQQKCVHFNGTIHESCEAGICYDDVRDESTHPYSYPCFSDRESSTTCDKARFRTVEEAKAKEREEMAEIEEFLSKAKHGICPRCGTVIERERQVGRCVYAIPCGCRLWQGTARTREQLEEVHRGA